MTIMTKVLDADNIEHEHHDSVEGALQYAIDTIHECLGDCTVYKITANKEDGTEMSVGVVVSK